MRIALARTGRRRAEPEAPRVEQVVYHGVNTHFYLRRPSGEPLIAVRQNDVVDEGRRRSPRAAKCWRAGPRTATACCATRRHDDDARHDAAPGLSRRDRRHHALGQSGRRAGHHGDPRPSSRRSRGIIPRTPVFGIEDLFPTITTGTACWAQRGCWRKPGRTSSSGAAARGSTLGFSVDQALCRRITDETSIPATTSTLALQAALSRISGRRVAVVSPYGDAYQDKLIKRFGEEGFEVVAEAHAGIADNLDFAAMPDEAIAAMIREVAAARPDAILDLVHQHAGGLRRSTGWSANWGSPSWIPRCWRSGTRSASSGRSTAGAGAGGACSKPRARRREHVVSRRPRSRSRLRARHECGDGSARPG